MTYVMSCLNGCYSDFLRMLEKISFGKKDVMFLLGDISDTGDEPMELLCDLSCRENIWPVAGDRDAATAKMLSGFSRMLESGETPDSTFIAEMNSWAASGGRVALDAFRALDADMKEGVLDYLSDMAQYDTVLVGFPIWWYQAPRIIETFLESYDFSGKTVIPFATSGGSGMGGEDVLRSACSKGTKWLPGKRLSSRESMASVQKWVESLGL